MKTALMVTFCASLMTMSIAQAQSSSRPQKPEMPKKTFTVTSEAQRTASKNQANTNTCWDFATNSFIESEVARRGGGLIELSEMFGVRQAYPLKAQAYIRAHGQAALWGGGNNHDAIEMMRQYGAVPREHFTGLKQNETTLNHDELDNGLKAYLDAVVKTRQPSKAWQKAVDGILDAYIGKPPEKFLWKGKMYTPSSFRDDVLKLNPDDYVEITSFTHHPFYQRMRLEIPDNWSHDNRFLNVPLADMEAIMKNALSNGYSLAWGGDVSENGFSTSAGYAVLDDEDEKKAITQAERQAGFDNWRSTDDHSMHIVGLSQDENKNLFFLTKNSAGEKKGPYQGHLHMSRNYVLMKTIYFMVHKDAIPADIRKKAGM